MLPGNNQPISGKGNGPGGNRALFDLVYTT